MKRTVLTIILVLLHLAGSTGAAPRKPIRVGFFEAGEYYSHSVVRNMYRDALEHLVPEQYRVIYLPNGFKTAEWKRDLCKAKAAEYVRDTSIDMVVAIGPWVVGDLLSAGYTRPIIGLLQHDAVSEGLLDVGRRPIADNLTVHIQPNKIKQDFGAIVELYHPKRIGVLAFNDGIRDTAFFQKCWQTGKAVGVDVTWAQAYGAGGTYAFFKAFNSLSKHIDVLYVSPLWGLTLPMIGQFVANAQNDDFVLFSSEGRYLVEKGLSAAGSIRGEQSMALFAAWKTSKIIAGAIPADLPVEYPEQRGYLINRSSALAQGQRIAPEILAQADILDEFVVSPETEILTQADALSRAQTQNPGYQAVGSSIDAAERRLEQARSGYFPAISFDVAATAASAGATTNSAGTVSRERYRAGLSVEQPLIAPSILKSIKLARDQRSEAEATVVQATSDLGLAVKSTFLDCLSAQYRVAELSRLRDRVEEFREIARFRAFTDPKSPDDTPRWEKSRFDILRQLIEARQDSRITLSALHTLMGRPLLDSTLALDSAGCTQNDFLDQFVPLRLVMTSERFSASALQFLETEAARNNGGMKQKSARVAVEGARLDFSRSHRYPTIGLRGWFGFADSLYNRVGFQEEHNLWSLSAQMSWPLFSRVTGKSESRVAGALQDRAQFEKDSVRLEVVAAVQNECRRLLALGLQMPIAAMAAAKSEEYVDSVRFDYMTGRRSVVEALDAVQAESDSRTTQLTIRNSFFQTTNSLFHSLGWSSLDQAGPAGVQLANRIQEYLRSTITPKKSP